MNDELSMRLQNLISSIELVFDIDWYYTQSLIPDEDFISKNGTFLNPFPGEHFTGG